MELQQQPLSLNDGQIIGPEHHKFKLKGTATPHPLGELWQADDISTPSPTPVSLIILSATLTKHKDFLSAFKQQVILTKNIRHKHITAIYGYFLQRGGILFVACEALDGLTLQSLIQTKKTDQLKETQIRGLLTQIAIAADFYITKTYKPHAALAPDLIYINRQGGVKFLPINPRILLEKTSFKLDPAFQFPAYQSPEAFHPNLLPNTADVYSVACIAYAAISGSAPFALEDDEALHVNKALKKPSRLNKQQWATLQQALDTDPQLRQRNSVELISTLFTDDVDKSVASTEIDALSEETAALKTEKTEPTKTAKTRQRTTLKRRLSSPVFIGSFLFTLGVVLGFFASVLFSQQQQQQALTNQHLAAWKEQADRWKTIAADNTREIARLKEILNQQNVEKITPTEPISREKVQLQENFTIFQDVLKNGSYGPEMISLPAGQFQMGDLNNQGDDNEKPIHTIIFADSFALSRYEVTFSEYDQFAIDTKRKLPDDEGWGRGSQPVVNISWQDANAYVKWLSAQTAQSYRLPSEAEWEYAARSGTNTAYWWGNKLSNERAICDGCGSRWDAQQPAPVGSLPATPWGLHDLNGNVDEWVADCYADSYNGHPNNGKARLINGCSYRSMRGGSWFDIGRVIRSASRYRHPPGTSRNTWGFRVALDLPK